MSNDGQKRQAGFSNHRSSSSSSGRSNGFFPSSLRTISSYLKIVSSGASTVASTVRSASASVASSVSDRERDAKRDQVQWAGFDKLECEGEVVRRVLLLSYRSGFQVWDVEEADDVRELVSRHDGPVSFLQMQQKPLVSKRLDDKFAEVRPLLVVAGDGVLCNNNCVEDALASTCNGNANNSHEMENGSFLPTVVRFYSLKLHSYVHVLKFRTAIYSIRCSPRVVAISQAAQIHCLNALTLEKEYTILTHPIALGSPGSGGIGYGPLAVGPRWLAYSGSPVAISAAGRVSPQHLTRAVTFSSTPSNGSLVAHYAKESSKQLAAGIVTLGDIGYKRLSRYCSELLPDCDHSMKVENPNLRTNGLMNGHLTDAENVGMVVVRDIVSKSVIAQFRAHRSSISALCFDPSGTLLVTASIQGHNINIFRIMPFLLSNSAGFDLNGSSVHLYKLQRGLTNAVIQDISFSDDSQWIMVSSCRGTSHLFSLSPPGCVLNKQKNGLSFICSSNGLNSMNKLSVRWPPTQDLSKHGEVGYSASGFPVTLSVVSRIKNGTNGWRGTVSGAAAAATGRVNALSGAIASAFHKCKGNDVFLDSASLSTRHHLLVFSPLGSVTQYVLYLSPVAEAESNVPGVKSISYEVAQENDMRLVVEAVQKWDICQKKKRREREDNVDIYGEHGNADNTRLFVKGSKKGPCIYPTDNGIVPNENQSAEEKQHLYISEVELQMHPTRVPLWARSEFYFQVMMMDESYITQDAIHGEMEIEKVSTRVIEVRPRDLMPVSDDFETPKVQQSSMASPADGNHMEALLHQKSGLADAGKAPCQSSCKSSDTMSESASVVDEVLTDLTEGIVNKTKGLKLTTQLEFVNSEKSPKMEPQLKFVNNRNCQKMEIPFENGYLSD